jgi:uncharacterized protein YjbJ (UPF0337 family)
MSKEHAMNWDQIEGKWKQAKGAIKQKWGKLTDDDLDVINGKQDELIGKIQERYGITWEDAQKQLDSWDFSDVSVNRETVPGRKAS